MYDLIDLLADIDNAWNEIGMALRVDESVLDNLSRSPQHTAEAKLQKVIAHWMKKKSPRAPVTWEYLISAIEGPILQFSLSIYLLIIKCAYIHPLGLNADE